MRAKSIGNTERKAAEKGIENIRGVKGVVNSIIIKEKPVDPSEVKKKISTAFHRQATIDAANILVNVNGSIVKLTGTVRSWQEWQDAEDIAWSTPGVTEVQNKLEIERETNLAK